MKFEAEGITRRFLPWKVHITLTSITYLIIVKDLVSGALFSVKEDENRYLLSRQGPVCVTPGCIYTAATVLKNMDRSVHPCDDFYQFACGGFQHEHSIPEDKSILNYFNIISDRLVDQLRTVIEQPPKPGESKPFVMVKKLYNACLNTTAVEETGLQTIHSLLQWLGGWPVLKYDWNENLFDWRNTMYNFREVGLPTDNFVAMAAGQDSKNTSQRLINFDQAQLGLDREYLVQGFDNEVVRAYYDYLVDLAVIFGADRETAMEDMKEVVEFEIELAQITLPREERRNYTALYHPMTIKQLQDGFPPTHWLEYINNIIGLPDVKVSEEDIVDVGIPQFITNFQKLLHRTPKRVQANYLLSQVIMDAVPYLTQQLRDRELEYKKVSEGTLAMEPRWKECIEEASIRLKPAMSALYVRKYFKDDAKNSAQELVNSLKETFISMLFQVDWMDGDTKKKAIEKARAIETHIAYPQELLDDKKIVEYYEKLEPSDNYYEFNLRIKKFNEDDSFRKLREPVNKTYWIDHSFATSVNAYYNPLENSVMLPAGILQGVFFDDNRPHYMNYGSMGFAIGHEITHGFDDVGRQYDKNGDVREWWAEDTKEAFLKKAQCIIDQYGNYTAPEVDLHLNGINTQGENIADNGGSKEAYLAYNLWVERHGEEPRLPGLNYTPRQMFWISTANLWCATQRDEYLKQEILTDDHAPAYFRVVGVFSNSEYFAKDFNCPLGSRMNPKFKCHVW